MVAIATETSAADTLAALVGGARDPVGYVVWRPEGGESGTLPWADFAAWLEGTALGGALREGPDGPVDGRKTCAGGVVETYCGPDAGASPAGSCRGVEGWVMYAAGTGFLQPPVGSAFQVRETLGFADSPCCSPFSWPCYDFAEVELSPSKDVRVLMSLVGEGCYAQRWAVHANGYCPHSQPGGVLDTFVLHWRGRGVGLAASFSVGFPAVVIDMFIGHGEGLACYDLPPEAADAVELGDVQCPAGTTVELGL